MPSPNPAQGMNELLAPLYYLCANDPDPALAAHAESDAFYCLVTLMADFRRGPGPRTSPRTTPSPAPRTALRTVCCGPLTAYAHHP